MTQILCYFNLCSFNILLSHTVSMTDHKYCEDMEENFDNYKMNIECNLHIYLPNNIAFINILLKFVMRMFHPDQTV